MGSDPPPENTPSGPFEGPEKLLELWFSPSADHVKGTGLRSASDDEWKQVLSEVQCQVLSTIELPASSPDSNNGNVKAYLLSESSLFVWPHKIILKTCGTTTLLLGLPSLFALAKRHGLPPVWRCFYSRKSFMFPQYQKGPHRAWQDEVDCLMESFPNGASYTVGNLTGDHWLLFLTPSMYNTTPDISAPLPSPSTTAPTKTTPTTATTTANGITKVPLPSFTPDQTLEILMTDLDEECCNNFYVQPQDIEKHGLDGQEGEVDGHQTGKDWTKRLGFSSLMPDATPDSFVFSPCGYSANFIQPSTRLKSQQNAQAAAATTATPRFDAEYATVHVTPERGSSYASFETNIALDLIDARQLVRSVLAPFQPKRLCLTLFVSKDDEQQQDDQQTSNAKSNSLIPAPFTTLSQAVLDPLLLSEDGYRRRDKIVYEFDGYDLIYASFVR